MAVTAERGVLKLPNVLKGIMFFGHAALALAIVGLGAVALGYSRAMALRLGLFAAVVATLPDIDMIYALTGLASAGSLDAFGLVEGFWAASTAVHRSITHSLVLALPVAAGIGLIAAGGRRRRIGLAAMGGVFLVLAVGSDPLVWMITAAFLLAAVGAGVLAVRWDIDPALAGLAGAVALLSHPFGDLFTGEPPWMLYPLDTQLLSSRITLVGDPTLHLLGAFFIELAAIWLGVFALSRLRGSTIRSHIRPRAAVGGAYAIAVLLIPAPTLSTSYQFVFSVTAVGFVGAVSRRGRGSWPTRIVTGLAAVTAAGLAYAAGYLVL